MEENSKNKSEINDENSAYTLKSNTEELKEPNPEKVINMSKNNANLQNVTPSVVDMKNEKDIPAKTIPKPKKDLPIEKSHSRNLLISI